MADTDTSRIGTTEQLRVETFYGRDQDSLRVFVSSQMGDTLTAERRTAAQTIDKSQMHHPWWWEGSSRAGSYWAEEECYGYAEASDGIVLLLGTTLTRVTRGEYEAARRGGAECFIFIRESDAMDDEATAFVSTEQRQSAVTKKFQNLSELESSLTAALLASAVRAARAQIHQRRIEFGSTIPSAKSTVSTSDSSRDAT